MLGEFEHESKITRKFLERVPQDKLMWKPHEKSHTAGALGLHIANVPAGVIRAAVLVMSPRCPILPRCSNSPPTSQEILSRSRKKHRDRPSRFFPRWTMPA